MRKTTFSLLLLFAVLLAFPVSADAFFFRRFLPTIRVQKFQVTDDSHQENSPAIFNQWVVYSDWGGADVDLRIYNLRNKKDKTLITDAGHQTSADIWNKTVVYQSCNVDCDIYGVNIKTKEKFPVAVLPDSEQVSPAIFGHLVVWSDNRNGNYDIYGYNLITTEEFAITDDLIDNHKPRIWGNKVVWYTHLGGGFYIIEGYDLLTKQKFDIAAVNNGYQQSPDIFNNQVVWIDTQNGKAKVYYKNLLTGQEKVLTDSGGKSLPKIYGRYVTWVDNEGVAAHNIYAYDLILGRVVQISDDRTQQASPTIPDIWGNTIVWMSWHTGNGDIYAARVR